MKTRRQSAILDAIQRGPIHSQEELRRAIRAAGFRVTQATLSRDIRELGLVKAEGAYTTSLQAGSNGHGHAQPMRPMLNRAVSEYLTKVDQVQQLVVLRTGPGQAQLLGVALDSARLPELVGTIAGDDTILAITRDARHARALIKRLEGLTRG
jgi:transcriptional regulator of arginine metabolism